MSGHAIRARLAQADGVTLIELLVALSILGIVLAGMTTLFVSASTSQIDQSNRVQAQQEARIALDALRREIHCATAVTGTPPTASITLTLGPYCANSGTTLVAPNPFSIPVTGLTVPTTITVANASAFAAMPKIYVGNSSGEITCTGKTATSFTGCTGGVKSDHVPPAAVTGITTITWCTQTVASQRYALWRYRGAAPASCGVTAGGVRKADYLTTGQVFAAYNGPNVPAGTGNLATLGITLPVDLTPNDSKQRYTLGDDIVLRNSGRLTP